MDTPAPGFPSPHPGSRIPESAHRLSRLVVLLALVSGLLLTVQITLAA